MHYLLLKSTKRKNMNINGEVDIDIGYNSTKPSAAMLEQPDMSDGVSTGNSVDSTHHAKCTTQTPSLPSQSNASAISHYDITSAAHLVYDSGNYSICSNTSDTSGMVELEIQGHYERYQTALRAKDQSLFLAMQDLRKLRSELERLSKSEQWYKQELRTQKGTRLEALERLYSQERKYIEENQRLQRECMRLYENCREMEKELNVQREQAVQQLANEKQQGEQRVLGTSEDGTFETQQQRAIISDQQQLINVLRKQKRVLLDDIRRLTEEKDDKVLELQRTMASMELEATHVTAQCKRLFSEKRSLEEALECKNAALTAENTEKFKLQGIICHLKADLQEQECLVATKECEIIDLQKQFKCNIKTESNMDEVHRLSVTYHEDINAKTLEIIALKKSLKALEEELNSFAELQTKSEQQERLIENLNFNLHTLRYEMDNMKDADIKKSEQITELQQNLEAFHNEREGTLEQLLSSQAAFKKIEKELIDLNEQYANMCALCERTRFQLELCEIDQGKLHFQAECDQKEIKQLREKLKSYLAHIKDLSSKIHEVETKLNITLVEKEKLEEYLRASQRQIYGGTAQHLDDGVQFKKYVTGKIVDSGFSERLKSGLKESTEFEIGQTGKGSFLQEPDCVVLMEQQKKLQSYLDFLTDAVKEKEHILDAMNNLIGSELNSKENTNSLHIASVNMKKLIGENRELKAQLNATERAQQTPYEKAQESPVSTELIDKQTDTELVKRKIELEEDLKQYQFADHVEVITALQIRNELLCKEMETLLTAKESIEAVLEQERSTMSELKSKLELVEKTESQELLNFKVKVNELEEKLQAAVAVNDDRRDRRIALINQLLEQQNNKVNQLNASQAEWEDLLRVLNATQQLEENNRTELNLKNAELEELNALFAEQNVELRNLQQIGLLAHCRSDEDFSEMQATFQQQVRELQEQLNDKLQENQTQKSIIEDLKCKNEILQRSSSQERLNTSTMQTTIEKLEEDRNICAKQMVEMETELNEIRKSKREALMLPSEFALVDTLSANDESSSSDYSQKDANDRLRILTKVLEAECRRKIKRYDLHIHSLLNNVKSLKKSLRSAERRAANLTEEQSRTAADLRDFQINKYHLEEMRLKLDQSQCTIKALELALESERKKFEASDFGKSTNPRRQTEEPVHEVANLIDDYKKLIQQSASTTHRPKTSIVLELIQRSNQFMPNLNKLESSVDGLRGDLEHFLSAYVHNTYGPSVINKLDAPSLLDELRAATENF